MTARTLLRCMAITLAACSASGNPHRSGSHACTAARPACHQADLNRCVAPGEQMIKSGRKPERQPNVGTYGHSHPHFTALDRIQPHMAALGNDQPRPDISRSGGVSAGGGRCWVRTNVGEADGFTVRRRGHPLRASELGRCALKGLADGLLFRPGCVTVPVSGVADGQLVPGIREIRLFEAVLGRQQSVTLLSPLPGRAGFRFPVARLRSGSERRAS